MCNAATRSACPSARPAGGSPEPSFGWTLFIEAGLDQRAVDREVIRR
jgi:hypothetical protein